MKVAVLGAGFCGLAVTWYLLQHKDMKITLFDQKGIGAGASGMAAGLLHKYAGAHSKLNPKADEAFLKTKELLRISEEALGHAEADYSGILRIATQPDQIQDYKKCALNHPDVEWNDSPPSLFIKEGITVNCNAYLNGLWLACQNLGAQLEIHKIHSLEEFDHYDHIVVCLGASTNLLPELNTIRLSKVKGQLLELEWPSTLPPLKHTLNSYAYIAMLSPTVCLAGSTYERDFISDTPDLPKAYELLMPKIVEMVPELESAKVLGCRAGIRASTPNRLPLLQRISPKVTILTGLGSKGLLYHALYAHQCSKLLLETMHAEN